MSPFAYQLLLIPSAVPEVHSSANQKPLCMTGDCFSKAFLFIQLFSSLQVQCSVLWLMGFLKFLTFIVCTNTAAGVQKHVLDVQEGNLGRRNMVMAIKFCDKKGNQNLTPTKLYCICLLILGIRGVN